MSKLELLIIMAVNKHGIIHGTERLMEVINVRQTGHKARVVTAAIMLQKHGYIAITPGSRGRGNKTIYQYTAASMELTEVIQ